MRKVVYMLSCLLLVSAIGCQKGPYPYISSSAVKKIDSLVHPAIANAAFIYQHNIYYISDFTKPVTQITTDKSAGSFVRMSHDHTKFAYKNGQNIIVIVDNKGNLITTLPQYTEVASFDWSADDKTLYILNNSTMNYYGPSMNLPEFTYPGIVNGISTDIRSASVSMRGDFAYVVHSFYFLYGDDYELVIIPANNGKVIAYKNPDFAGNEMNYVNFSSNRQDLVVGYATSNPDGNVELFSDLKNYPDQTYDSGNSATPVYNSTLNYIVQGYADPNNNDDIDPAALYLGPPPELANANVPHSIALYKYPAPANSTIYTDWK